MKLHMLRWALAALACAGLSGTVLAQDDDKKKPDGAGDRPERPERPDRPGGPGGGRPDPSQIFKAMDANEDGKVTKKEFKAFHLKRLEEIFARMDEDKSGDISKEEAAKMRGPRRRGPGPDAPAGGGDRRRRPDAE